MLLPAPPLFPRKRKPPAKPKRTAPPAPGAPVLIAATYLASTWVRLTFDRPVTFTSPIESDELFVNDEPGTETLWVGSVITALGAAQIEVSLLEYDPGSGTETTLSASATTGIVSAFDGTAWAGVTNVELPFP